MQSVAVLGSTGSIGVSTLDVLARHPERYSVYALTANRSLDALFQQVEMFSPHFAVVADTSLASKFSERIAEAGLSTEVLSGEEGLCRVASQADVTMAAIVGAAGLMPTMAAVEAGKKVLLANKEALVMAGPLFMEAVQRYGATLLPIDSEHNAIFQCLPAAGQAAEKVGLASKGVQRILLTGSGGPFRATPLAELAEVTPDQACAHPNWSMGRKISVDSATMMNKGLELIEACWLFHTDAANIDIIVHPQSVIHSMVEYIDGSVLAQLGNPDMRTPIAHALAWPERIASGVAGLDIITQARLDFEAPDEVRFPCLRLAREAALRAGTAPAVLNAANEVAVDAFLNGHLSFVSIPVVIEEVMGQVEIVEPHSLRDVQNADQQSRACAMDIIAKKFT
ncbi:1-deoxy-D-xylulose 5-phosphate reductoisomerase [Zhongshania aliphaticivorans]|uniref:1-deoxy-D-xylulose 5-phosphate reductoisomerase n=1 Tax=Zhongshania aliphaticivorans TaxID=1470434 RepID=A0A5S9MR56_9GAMM|nr:1-deoxy-D-xylulose 5-phosphate reductoisomerase [Zhongshania aliphaticivorans]CAA0086542.1 1-deoxy-D-xylulose 5-phosphate reductoisomerase [Zhongshania aliphaticivorans]